MIYSFTRIILRVLFRVCYRWRLVGVENVPAKGGVLLVSNHTSMLDPPLIGAAIANRTTHIMAKRELFNNPIFNMLIKAHSGFPVSRGRADRAALRTIFDLLGQGRMVLFFPEGTRSLDGKLAEIKRGSGFIALNGKAPLVPIYIQGSHKLWPKGKRLPCLFGRIVIKFGAPFVLDAAEAKHADDINQWAALRIGRAISELEADPG